MNKPLIGILLGGILGIFDGLTAFGPAFRDLRSFLGTKRKN